MRRTVRKWFFIWDFDKEERWLNEMAALGLCLVSVGWCRYEFEDCSPGEYGIRLELLKEKPEHPESVKYMEFLEETGAEHVGSYMRWIYLRKKKTDGDFRLFSDNDSRIRHLTRILQFTGALGLFNLLVCFYNLTLFFRWGTEINLIGLLSLAIGAVSAFGYVKLWRKRKQLKQEQQLFE